MKPYIISHMMESVDGRKGMVSVFEGIDDPGRPVTLLTLERVERVWEGTVWLRYKVKWHIYKY